jgi:hypothetical protein
VAERPISGTCNGNGDYQAVLSDVREDTRFVSVQFANDGGPWVRIADTGSSEQYRWFDRDSRTLMRLCVEGLGCAWGATRAVTASTTVSDSSQVDLLAW